MCRLDSVVTDGQTEGHGEPKRRVCVTYPVRDAKYIRMNQYTKLRKIKLGKKQGEKEIHSYIIKLNDAHQLITNVSSKVK